MTTKSVRKHRQRRQAGYRLLQVWLTPTDLAALRDYGLIADVGTTDPDVLAVAAQALLRALDRREVRIERSWAMCDALARDDKQRGARMVDRITEREMLITGYPSAFGCPKRRVTIEIETV